MKDNTTQLFVIQEVVYHHQNLTFQVKTLESKPLPKEEAVKLCEKWNALELSDSSRVRRFRYKASVEKPIVS